MLGYAISGAIAAIDVSIGASLQHCRAPDWIVSSGGGKRDRGEQP